MHGDFIAPQSGVVLELGSALGYIPRDFSFDIIHYFQYVLQPVRLDADRLYGSSEATTSLHVDFEEAYQQRLVFAMSGVGVGVAACDT